ncbi:formamidopyrimidine-DNA glycosylase [Striga asiatica]|uniref:Formamidopyrimidine-DNA glycosylase n=1 Tax=Striga asiatica TaxID=4170 RepID=A0A5A7QFS9_STRAF|nr:formamidopyrimidine-DNA glycosylase [Striga asiatica]
MKGGGWEKKVGSRPSMANQRKVMCVGKQEAFQRSSLRCPGSSVLSDLLRLSTEPPALDMTTPVVWTCLGKVYLSICIGLLDSGKVSSIPNSMKFCTIGQFRSQPELIFQSLLSPIVPILPRALGNYAIKGGLPPASSHLRDGKSKEGEAAL